MKLKSRACMIWRNGHQFCKGCSPPLFKSTRWSVIKLGWSDRKFEEEPRNHNSKYVPLHTKFWDVTNISDLPNYVGSIADRSFNALNCTFKKPSAVVYSSFQTLQIHHRNIYICIFARAVQASLLYFENMRSSFRWLTNRFAHVIAFGLSKARYIFCTKF